MKLLNHMLDTLFGCRHSKTSRVWSRIRGTRGLPYVTCLDCGKELPYSLEEMRIGGESVPDGEMESYAR